MHSFQVEEVAIEVPWGKVAGKWWGPKNVRPILALHGWQDNAGSFDAIIPRLPTHLSYLALDLPGHGHSSRIPHGIFYCTALIKHVLNIIRDHYKWNQLSLMAHSMGSIISFQYVGIYPERCDLLVALDALKPMQRKPSKLIELLATKCDEFAIADARNRQQAEPPSYTYDEIIDRWIKGTNNSITKEAAPALVRRAIAPSSTDPKKFYFTRDSRLKSFNHALISQEVCLEMARRIKMPYLLIKAANSPYYENKKYFDETVQVLEENNPKFEWCMVDGTHHCHLTEPALVEARISQFLNKYRPA